MLYCEGYIVNVVDDCSLVDGPVNTVVMECGPDDKLVNVSPEEPI